MLDTKEDVADFTRMVRRIAREARPIVYPRMRQSEAVRLDSIGVVNFVEEFRTIVQKPFRDEYKDLKAKDFIPPSDMGIRTMDEQWAAKLLSVVGEGKWGTDAANDSGDVTIAGQLFGGVVGSVFATAAWDQFDVIRAAYGETNIPTETLTAARYVVETSIDTALSVGVPSLGIGGFLTSPSVAVTPLPTGSWNLMTFDQIVSDVIAWVYVVRGASNFIELQRPDTILMPPSLFGLLVGKVSATTGINAITVLRNTMKEHGITAIEEWSKLTTAGAAGGYRVVLYRRNPDAVQAIVPTPFYQIAPQMRDWKIRVPSMARCGGSVFIKPLSAAYADNAHS